MRFLVAGGLAYAVNQAALFLLYTHGPSFGAPGAMLLGAVEGRLLVASLIALELSILVRFALNDRWTFRALDYDSSWLQRLYRSNLGSFGSPLISLAAVNLLTPHFGVSYLVANSLGIALGLAWNWGWSTRVVWTAGPVRMGRRVSIAEDRQPALRPEEARNG